MDSDSIFFEALKPELVNQPVHIRETKLRRFLSEKPKCVEAWSALIDLVQFHNDLNEAVRLSSIALMHFKNDHKFLNQHIDLLLRLGYFSDAQLLLEKFDFRHKININRALDIFELNFINDPLFEKFPIRNFFEKIPKNNRVTFAQISSEAYKKNGKSKICFYLSADWHWTIQKSIASALDIMNISYYVTTQIWMLKVLQPKIVVISDALPHIISWIRFHLPNTRIVSARHGIGIGGKNYGLYAAAATDYICVTSRSLKNDLCKEAMLEKDRVWVTGFSQMDRLFAPPIAAIKHSNLARVTFAPTADPKLSSIELIGDNPIYWIRGNNNQIHLTIRPHPNLFRIANGLMNSWKEMARKEKNVVIDDDPFSDPSELLINTDLLISDVSSIVMQFIALNKPIICLVDMNKAKLSPKYAPDELEWKIHSAAVLVNKKEDLTAAVESALNDSPKFEMVAERNRWRQYLFDDLTDGKSGERIAFQLYKLLKDIS